MDADSDEERLCEEYDSAYDDRYGTAEDDGWDLGADRVYWRRRFLILCAGVVALGVCAWLIPGANPPSARSAADARRSTAALNKRQPLPATAYGSARANPPPPPVAVRPSRPPPPPRRRAAAVRAGPLRAQLVHQPGELCAGRQAAFSVYAVSTAAAASRCHSAPAGPGDRDAQRARGVGLGGMPPRAGQARPLQLGVPQVLALTWNPKATRPPGCGGSLTANESGVFDAVAMPRPVEPGPRVQDWRLIRGRPP